MHPFTFLTLGGGVLDGLVAVLHVLARSLRIGGRDTDGLQVNFAGI